ncbi:MAG: tail assembly protein [Burkholderiaceae bacterium]|jgi:predicted phage tail protein|nr:tail assembly protein [Burkholderiaceae bacterium]
MREVRLYGALGAKFGRVHRFAVASAAEAVRALRANFPEFDRVVLETAQRYRVIVGRRPLAGAPDFYEPSGDREVIRIIPVLEGAKRGGLLQTIIGVVLIVVGVYTGNAWLTQAGIALTLGGVAQMLTPVPKLQAGTQDEENKSRASYVFAGAVNTTAQGVPVPVGYGRLVIGSAVISAGLTTQEVPT